MSSENRQTIEDSWEFLATLDPSSGYRARDIPTLQTPHGCLILSQDSEGTRHILVPIGADEPVAHDTESRGVQLVKTSLSDEGKLRHFVDIRCPDPRLHRVFDQIVVSMLDTLSSTEEPVAATCVHVLGRWRALLRRVSKPLSPAVLRGVFGELWFLSRLVQHTESAANYWTGPDNTPQDFISAQGAFEIKTTLRIPARRVSISCVDQLDGRHHPFLVLVVISLVEDPKGVSIEDLLETLTAAGCPREQVLDQLAKVGIQEADLPDLAGLRWRVAAHTGYRVADDFPRLTPTSFAPVLPPGIQNLRYEVDLGTAAGNVLSEVELIDLEHQFMTGPTL